jgi:hypothetical protein
LAVVLSNDVGAEAADAQAVADSGAVAERLFFEDYEVVRRANPIPARLPQIGLAPEIMLIYYSGPVRQAGDDLFLPAEGWTPPAEPREAAAPPLSEGAPAATDGDAPPPAAFFEGVPGWFLSDLMADPFGVRARRLVVLLETCHAGAPAPALPRPVIGGSDRVLVMPAADADCAGQAASGTRLTDTLLAAAEGTGPGLDARLDDAGLFFRTPGAVLPQIFAPSRAGAAVPSGGATVQSVEPQVFAPAAGEAELIRVAAEGSSPPFEGGQRDGGGQSAGGFRSGGGLGDGGGFGFGGAQPAAGPLAGRPRPSIIVGLILQEPSESDGRIGETVPDGEDEAVAATPLDLSDREARLAFRAENQALFETLVRQGQLDPADGDFETAIQIELAASNCYRAGIDGIWGAGSRGAVTAYFEELGQPAPSVEATAEVLRAVLIGGPVACPTPVATPAPATGGGGGGGGGGGATIPTTPTTQPTQTPATPSQPLRPGDF